MDQQQFLSKSTLRAIICMGLIVGTLDILSAIVDYYIASGNGPANIFKYISSGIMDKAAFEGGRKVIILGLLLHYMIAFSFTIFFVALYMKSKFMSGNKIIVGVLYGIFIGVVMNFMVVRLSYTPKGPFVWYKYVKAFLILICMIGLPLAFLAPRFLGKNKNENT
jgi:hypothetical protein